MEVKQLLYEASCIVPSRSCCASFTLCHLRNGCNVIGNNWYSLEPIDL